MLTQKTLKLTGSEMQFYTFYSKDLFLKKKSILKKVKLLQTLRDYKYIFFNFYPSLLG